MLYLSILLRVGFKRRGVADLRSNPAVFFRNNKPRTFFDGYSYIVDKAQGNLMSFVLCQFRSFFTVFLTGFPLFRWSEWWTQDCITSKIERCEDIFIRNFLSQDCHFRDFETFFWLPLSFLYFTCETIILITRLIEPSNKSL
jgi:hypothetical protein